MKTDVKSAVYRFVGTSGVNHLALMVGVYSNDPLETLRKYLKRSAVETHEEPRLVPTLSADSPKLDLILESIPDEPGYAIRNRLKQSCLERILVD